MPKTTQLASTRQAPKASARISISLISDMFPITYSLRVRSGNYKPFTNVHRHNQSFSLFLYNSFFTHHFTTHTHIPYTRQTHTRISKSRTFQHIHIISQHTQTTYTPHSYTHISKTCTFQHIHASGGPLLQTRLPPAGLPPGGHSLANYITSRCDIVQLCTHNWTISQRIAFFIHLFPSY